MAWCHCIWTICWSHDLLARNNGASETSQGHSKSRVYSENTSWKQWMGCLSISGHLSLMRILIQRQFIIANPPTDIFLGGERKLESPGEIRTENMHISMQTVTPVQDQTRDPGPVSQQWFSLCQSAMHSNIIIIQPNIPLLAAISFFLLLLLFLCSSSTLIFMSHFALGIFCARTNY